MKRKNNICSIDLSKLNVYLSQPIAGNKTPLPDFIMGIVNDESIQQFVNFIDPKKSKLGKISDEELVKHDLDLILESNLLLLDLTRGYSFGATAETVYAREVGVPILAVAMKPKSVSRWAHFYCDGNIVTPRCLRGAFMDELNLSL